MGIIIGETDEQGKGYGKEVMELIIDYAFNTLNLNKVIVEVVEYNKRALEVYKKLGFIEEGRLKKHYYADGEYFDVIILAIFN